MLVDGIGRPWKPPGLTMVAQAYVGLVATPAGIEVHIAKSAT